MSPTSLSRPQLLTMLAEGPLRITTATGGLTESQLRAAPSPGEWSANEVLAHLRACADVWGNCIMTILQADRPTIRAVNPRTWINSTNYLELEFQPSLQTFSAQRTALLTVLQPLRAKDWSRSANITGAGKPLVRTIESYAEWIAIHERPHVKQIQRIAITMSR